MWPAELPAAVGYVPQTAQPDFTFVRIFIGGPLFLDLFVVTISVSCPKPRSRI